MSSHKVLNSFAHRFLPASSSNQRSLTLLPLHGTGGNEDDLIPLATELSPNSAILSPRGRVIESGMPRFFRRFAEGIFDIEDVKLRSNELADFISSASKEYKFNPTTVVALGYSNGANIAASMLFLRPQVLLGAILFRALLPFVPEKLPNLSGKSIFLSEGKYDRFVSRDRAENLKALLEKSGANVTLNWVLSDHSLVREEVEKAKRFLEANYTGLLH
jgi:predicted esterase